MRVRRDVVWSFVRFVARTAVRFVDRDGCITHRAELLGVRDGAADHRSFILSNYDGTEYEGIQRDLAKTGTRILKGSRDDLALALRGAGRHYQAAAAVLLFMTWLLPSDRREWPPQSDRASRLALGGREALMVHCEVPGRLWAWTWEVRHVGADADGGDLFERVARHPTRMDRDFQSRWGGIVRDVELA